jgi:hypothetical protein
MPLHGLAAAGPFRWKRVFFAKGTLTELREQVITDNTIRLVCVSTLDRVADCLTKPLSGPDIKRFHSALSGYCPIPRPHFGSAYGRIGKSLEERGTGWVPYLCSLVFGPPARP